DGDSASGVRGREVFGLFGAVVPLMMLRRLLRHHHAPIDEALVTAAAAYVVIRYGLSYLFKRLTVHRGMFHSIPAMLIAGLATFLIYHHPDTRLRFMLAFGVMTGFFSHLLLDELYSVDLRGVKPKLNKYSGSALKFASPSQLATGVTYLVLLALGFLAFLDSGLSRTGERPPVVAKLPAQ